MAYVPATRIRIPTFSSPVKRQDGSSNAVPGSSALRGAPGTLTREEARAGRLNPRLQRAGGSAWANNFQDLMKRTGAAIFTGSAAPPPPKARSSSPRKTSAPRSSSSKPASKASQARKSGAKEEATKKRRSSAAPRASVGAKSRPSSAASAAGNSSTSARVVKQAGPRKSQGRMTPSRPPAQIEPAKKRRSSVNARPSQPAPTSAKAEPARRKSAAAEAVKRVPRASVAMGKGKGRAVDPEEIAMEGDVSEEVPVQPRRLPRASAAARKSRARPSIPAMEDEPMAVVEEEVSPPPRKRKSVGAPPPPAPAEAAPTTNKRPAPAPVAARPLSKKSKAPPAPPPKKKRKLSPPLYSPPTEISSSVAGSDPALSEPETVPSSVEEDVQSSEDEGGSKGGVRVKTERLQGNEGKLNAVDLVWERVRSLVKGAIKGLREGPGQVALRDYAQSVQLALLTRSDTISTLSHSAALASSARAQAKALRTELLGVRQARAGVGSRMRAEESAWRGGKRRAESKRKLHAFVGQLSVGAMEWGVHERSGAQAELPLRARLEKLAKVVGTSAAQGGQLVRRVERLNRKLDNFA